MTRRRVSAGLGLLAVVAVGCGDDDGVEQVAATAATSTTTGQAAVVLVSDACVAAMQAAEDAMSEPAEIYDPVAVATVSECETVAEWAQAFHDRPGAMGLTELAVNDESAISWEEHQNISLYALCSDAPAEAPVCVDAAATGRLVPCRDEPDALCLPPV